MAARRGWGWAEPRIPSYTIQNQSHFDPCCVAAETTEVSLTTISFSFSPVFFVQTYILMTDTFERLDDMCAEIRDVEAKTSD
jgi:hypothetical protein